MLVDGCFLDWGFFGVCLVICGKGEMIRIWICINLVFFYGGKLCEGLESEIVECNKEVCF